jgi:hypothetical protein
MFINITDPKPARIIFSFSDNQYLCWLVICWISKSGWLANTGWQYVATYLYYLLYNVFIRHKVAIQIILRDL